MSSRVQCIKYEGDHLARRRWSVPRPPHGYMLKPTATRLMRSTRLHVVPSRPLSIASHLEKLSPTRCDPKFPAGSSQTQGSAIFALVLLGHFFGRLYPVPGLARARPGHLSPLAGSPLNPNPHPQRHEGTYSMPDPLQMHIPSTDVGPQVRRMQPPLWTGTTIMAPCV